MVKRRQTLGLACGVGCLWTVSLTASAQDESESDPETTEQSEEESDDREDPGQVATREPGPPWVLGRPYVDPAFGAVVFSDGAGGVTGLAALGASATLPFRQDIDDGARFGGEGRVVGQVMVGPDLYNGYAVRVGGFVGPEAGPARLRFGPDVFYNQYVLGLVDAQPFGGFGLPLTGYLAGEAAGLYAGVEPAWYVTGGWGSVDWSTEDAFGFGDEFTYRGGVHIAADGFALAVGYSHRLTAFGVQRGLTFGVGF